MDLDTLRLLLKDANPLDQLVVTAGTIVELLEERDQFVSLAEACIENTAAFAEIVDPEKQPNKSALGLAILTGYRIRCQMTVAAWAEHRSNQSKGTP